MAAKTIFYFVGILFFVDIQAQVSIVYDVLLNFKINISALIKITGSIRVNYMIEILCGTMLLIIFKMLCYNLHNENNRTRSYFMYNESLKIFTNYLYHKLADLFMYVIRRIWLTGLYHSYNNMTLPLDNCNSTDFMLYKKNSQIM